MNFLCDSYIPRSFHKTHHCHCLSHHNDNEQVIANSGAAKAGVRPGDIVTALDNNKVDTFELFMSVSFTYRSVMLQDSSHRNVLPCLKYLLSCFFLFYTYYFFIFHLFLIRFSWCVVLVDDDDDEGHIFGTLFFCLCVCR